MVSRFAAMAVAILFFEGHLCEGPGLAFGDEDGIIAEAAFAGGHWEDMAVADALELVFFIFPDQRDDGPEACAAVGIVVEVVEQLFDIILVGSFVAGIAGAFYPGFAVERPDFEAGVFAEAAVAGEPMDSSGLLCGVGFEGIVGFGDIDIYTGLAEADYLKGVAYGCLYLFYFMFVVSGKDDAHGFCF